MSCPEQSSLNQGPSLSPSPAAVGQADMLSVWREQVLLAQCQHMVQELTSKLCTDIGISRLVKLNAESVRGKLLTKLMHLPENFRNAVHLSSVGAAEGRSCLPPKMNKLWSNKSRARTGVA